MTYIHTIPESEAAGQLHELYAADLKKDGYIANTSKTFSLRPEALAAWRNLLFTIRANMDLRRYELVTIAAAATLRCKY